MNILRSDKNVYYTLGEDNINYRTIKDDEDVSDIPHIKDMPRKYSFDINGSIFHVYFEIDDKIIINYHGDYKIVSNLYVHEKIYTYSNLDIIGDV